MLLNADCRHVLPLLAADSVHCIVTDPAYRTISGGTGDPASPRGCIEANDGRIFAHNDTDITDYAADLFRVLTSPGHCWIFTNELNRRRFEDVMLAVGFKLHGLHGWLKNNATPNRWGMKNWEPVLLFRKGPARGFYTPGLKQMLPVNNPVGNKLHPTEKPVELVRKYILASSLPGQLVLDPFAGAGAVPVACAETGRQFIGCEIDPAYWSVGVSRIAALTAPS